LTQSTPAPWYHWDGPDLVLAIHVQPKSSCDAIAGAYGNYLKIKITAPPVAGKANDHLVRFLARLFDVPRRRIVLVSGQGSRSKCIRIHQPRRLPVEINVPDG
jgi:uncharacterized protein (TIGR00251 family)